MSISFLIVTLIFNLALGLAVYSCIRLLAYLLGVSKIRCLFVALALTVSYMLMLTYFRQQSPETYRFLLYFLGVISYGFFISLAFWVSILAAKMTGLRNGLKGRITAGLYVLVTIGINGWAIANYEAPVAVEEYTITSGKIGKPYKLLHISDVQYGSVSRAEMEERFLQAYALNPDAIVFTGDLIDFEHYQFEDFEVLQQSPVPIYFERGNHEFYHDPTRLLSYLNSVGPIRLLINSSVVLGDLEIAGVDYSREVGHVQRVVSQLDRDMEKFQVLLYHEPKDVEVAAGMNFDLQLYGHTHAGQIWPYTWLIDWLYEYSDGLFKVNHATVYVSDGVALWGPRMRLGSQNEMTLFHLLPE